MNKKKEETIEDILDDDDIRNFFQSRDPSRKKPNPFLTEETETKFGNKNVMLKVKHNDAADDGVDALSTNIEHQHHVRQVAKHFTWIGISIGLLLSIILLLIL